MIDDTGTNRHYRNRAPQLGETYDTVDITHLHHLSTLLRREILSLTSDAVPVAISRGSSIAGTG
jgi:hypothetical protein